MHLRHFASLVLVLITIVGVVDVAGLRVFDDLAVVGYALLYLIPAVVLLVLCVIGLRRDHAWLRAFDIAGVALSIGSVVVSVGPLITLS